jgi:hypothetical protein
MEDNVGTCFMSYNADSNGNVMHCIDGIPFWNYEFGMNLEDYGINRAVDVCRAWDPVNRRCSLIPTGCNHGKKI